MRLEFYQCWVIVDRRSTSVMPHFARLQTIDIRLRLKVSVSWYRQHAGIVRFLTSTYPHMV